MEYHISKEAYLKIFAHCIKYPVNQVTGILVGKKTQGSPSKVNVISAIPITHESILLSHNIEIALRQIDIYCKKNTLQIVGCYHANELVENLEIPELINLIARNIDTNLSGNSLLLMIDNQKLITKDDQHIFKAYVNQKGWKVLQTITNNVFIVEEGAIEKSKEIAKNGIYSEIVDFDSHLENVKLDWLNNDRFKI
ncbi:UPF0172-domain-containing protein [Neocallimastix californiae]|jgi:hypothetical protein|uniref:UPF0172-domain-containing protein n=1 Tax=Neocallimastix californiae TaxID=1754190 RepID=A0A1Y2DPL5_9FUNG|nr:UPF0172-domain-containing protein [Neocallimastix californiae]|eukprot:ORY61104.1 UPF0172-domain-containing protein [Neocallimastix californiae]